MLEHGGNLNAAVERYGRPLRQWVDLSTGVSPWAYPLPAISPQCWQALPQDDDGLAAAAAGYYGNEHLLPVAGSQAAIQALPRLFSKTQVAVLSPMYAEHTQAWRSAGHQVQRFDPRQDLPSQITVLVLCHPNNPTGECFKRAQLLQWRDQLLARGGVLIIDEAFMDCTPQHSLCQQAQLPGLVVLRSLGKFFGLAGARLGFVFSNPVLLAALRELLGPWPIAGPSRYVAAQALRDQAWQQKNRAELERAGQRLHQLLQANGLKVSGGCALFQWLCHEQAQQWHQRLAEHGIWTRFFEQPCSLRLGLPADEAQWQRLQAAVQELALHEDAA